MKLNFWKKETDFFTQSAESFDGAEQAMPEPEPVELSSEWHYYNAIVRWVLLVGAVLLPIFFLPWTSNILEVNKQLLLIVVAGVGLVVWLLGAVVSGQVSFRLSPFDRGVLAFLVGTAVVTVFSVARGQSLFGSVVSNGESLVTMLALSIFYFLVVSSFDDRGKSLATAMGASFLIAVTYGLLQLFAFYLGWASFTHSRAFNTVGSINALGFLAAVSLSFFNKFKLNVRKFNFAYIGVGVSLVILAILNSWALWTVAIAGMLAVTALDSVSLASVSGTKLKVSRFLLPITVTVLGIFLIIVQFNFSLVRSHLPTDASLAYSLTGSVIRAALKEVPVMGYGPENFVLAFDKYGAGLLANTSFSGARFFDATAQVFNWLVGGGIVMALAMLILLWAVIGGILKLRQYSVSDNDSLVTGSVFGATASLVAVLIGLFLYPLNITLTFTLFALMALVALGVSGHTRRTVNIEDNPVVSLVASVGFIVGLILVLTGFWFSGIHYYADAKFAQAVNEKNTDVAIAKLVQARNWYGDARYFRVLSQVALKLLADELKKPVDPQDKDRANRISSFMATARGQAVGATELGPREAENWYNLGLTYQNMVGMPSAESFDKLAEDAFKKAIELRPGDPAIPYQVGFMYLSEADLIKQLINSGRANAVQGGKFYVELLKNAETYFKTAVQNSGNFGLAIYSLGAVYERQGRVNEAIRQIELVMPSNANQPALWFELALLYYRTGRKDDAFKALQQSVVIAPQYSNARWYLALLFEERKDIDGALAQLTEILKSNSDNVMLKDKIAQLQAGKISIPPAKVIDQKPLDIRKAAP